MNDDKSYAGKSEPPDAEERISRLAADLVVSGYSASNAQDVERCKKEAEQKLLVFACDEIERHMKRNPSALPDYGGADAGVGETSSYNIKAIATVISLSYGEDPEADAELGRMCTADNKPVKCWEVYEAQAKALFVWFNAVLDSLFKPAPVAAEDEAYELGKCYGYEDAIQDLDIATGGDGEFKGSTIFGETVDVETMKQRIVDRCADVTLAELTEWVANEESRWDGAKAFARALLDAFTVRKRLCDKQGK